MSNTITLHQRDSHVYDGQADGAVTPGELLEQTGVSGDLPTYGAHSGAAEQAAPRFAIEYSHTGMTVDDDYADGDHLELRKGLPGDEFYAFLDAGASVTPGDQLVSAGNGALQAVTGDGSDQGVVVCEALETVDNGAGGSPVRIEIEVV